MKKTAVITGGAGGMGIAIARRLGSGYEFLLADVAQDRLDQAAAQLAEQGIRAEGMVCDIAHRPSVGRLLDRAAAMGQVAAVIHTAGLSPHMADPGRIMEVNALGTAYMIEETYRVIAHGGVMVNISSMAGHNIPAGGPYDQALERPLEEGFLAAAAQLVQGMASQAGETGAAYVLSKYFTIRYSKQNAARFGQKGARIVSVSPGAIETPMGRTEYEAKGSRMAAMLEMTPISRFGQASEIASAVAFLVGPDASYITGTDLLCDGGFIGASQNPQVGQE